MDWHDFYVATAGAAAALTGLIFVGISINLQKILAYPSLVTRASLSLVLLMSILIFSVLLLIPTTGTAFVGAILTVVGLGIWLLILLSDIKIYRRAEEQYRGKFFYVIVLDQICTILYIIGGFELLLSGSSGLYFIAAAIVFCFGKAVLDAWVLLIEILR